MGSIEDADPGLVVAPSAMVETATHLDAAEHHGRSRLQPLAGPGKGSVTARSHPRSRRWPAGPAVTVPNTSPTEHDQAYDDPLDRLIRPTSPLTFDAAEEDQ